MFSPRPWRSRRPAPRGRRAARSRGTGRRASRSSDVRRIGEHRFRVESSTQLTGLIGFFKRGEIHETSEFDYVGGDIRTLRFERRDDLSREDRNVRVDYDWERGVATIEYQGRSWQEPIEPGVSNTLVMQIALMQSLSNGERPPWLDVVGHKGRLRFEVEYAGDDRLAVDGEERVLYRYSHSRVDSGIRTTFWAEPARSHLPLIARIEKGRKLEGELSLLRASTGPSTASD